MRKEDEDTYARFNLLGKENTLRAWEDWKFSRLQNCASETPVRGERHRLTVNGDHFLRKHLRALGDDLLSIMDHPRLETPPRA